MTRELRKGEDLTIGVSGVLLVVRVAGVVRGADVIDVTGLQVFEEATPSVVYINTFVEQRDAFSMNVMEVSLKAGAEGSALLTHRTRWSTDGADFQLNCARLIV